MAYCFALLQAQQTAVEDNLMTVEQVTPDRNGTAAFNGYNAGSYMILLLCSQNREKLAEYVGTSKTPPGSVKNNATVSALKLHHCLFPLRSAASGGYKDSTKEGAPQFGRCAQRT